MTSTRQIYSVNKSSESEKMEDAKNLILLSQTNEENGGFISNTINKRAPPC